MTNLLSRASPQTLRLLALALALVLITSTTTTAITTNPTHGPHRLLCTAGDADIIIESG